MNAILMCSKSRLTLAFFIFFLILISISNKSTAQCDSSCCINPCKMSCCSKDLSPLSTMISHVHSKKEWMFSYRYMTMGMAGNYKDRESISNDLIFNDYLMSADRMIMQMHMLMMMYGISDKLTVMGMLHFNQNSMSMNMPEGANHNSHVHSAMDANQHHHHMSSLGIGDTKIYMLYQLIQKNNHTATLSLGTSIPSGRINTDGKEKEDVYYQKRLPYSMQIGSGSIELMTSLTYLYTNNKLACSVQLGYASRLNQNSVGYKIGNELQLSGWMAFKVSRLYALGYKADFVHLNKLQGKDISLNPWIEPAANYLNYGGTILNNSLVNHFFVGNHRLSIELGTPLWQSWKGVQMHRQFAFCIGWQLFI